MNIVEWRDQLSKVPRDKLSSSAKLMGHTLALFYRTGSKTYPTVDLLADRASVGEGTVNNAIKELIAYGIIKKIKDILPGEKSERNFYIFSGVEDSEITNCNDLKASTVEASSIEGSNTDASTAEASTVNTSTIEASSVEGSNTDASHLEASPETSTVEASPVDVKVDIYRSKKEKRERDGSPPPDFENLDLKKERFRWYQRMKAKHSLMTDAQINISYGVFLANYPKEKWVWPVWEKWVEMEKPEKYPASPPLTKHPEYKWEESYEQTLDKTFQVVRNELRRKHGDAIFGNMIHDIKLLERRGDTCYLEVNNSFKKQQLTGRFLSEITYLWKKIEPSIRLIELSVSKKGKAHAN